ncbi:secretin N-terminal domain-containing protein [Algisphaera agarilytica]|uniref:Type IV pilus assembly protein PilQ n=1 Tax=Algisphaera agarilytica TaxID=1385975 RepID=A0A7X0H6H7_9BACT|nr:secretin N-terminal domain-containing protein [Algisphaera agarilytica]MBB6430033.1 type IV pilus assembly protein PilQ [Algisphaera agarilytica]
MTSRDNDKIKQFLMAAGLGVAFSLTGASYAQAAEGDEPIGLFDENAQSLEGQDVAVDSLGQIDITVKDLEIAKVLQLLSIQSQRNIVASRNVSGKVSADLYGVSFNEALEAILTPNGYGYEEKGNFIYVYTAAELEERQNAMRKTVTKVVRLNYISSADASAFVTPLLSSNGSITATGEVDAGFLPSQSDGGENSFAHADTLLIRDYEENVEEIETVLNELDVRPKQVLVEATILQATLTEQNAFGVDFSVVANFDALADFTNPLGVVDQMINGTNTGGGGTGVSSTVGNTATGNAGIKVGVTGSDASVFLRALDQVTDTTVLAKPNILVLNRQKADLLVGERLGYLSTTVTDTSETQTIEFLDVGTQLSVRPFISEEGNIRLELRPSVSDGTTRLEGGFIIPDETTQELVTNIIVESGQTVVLGGLFVEDTQVGRNQVPGLGDLPFVGAAFKGHDDEMRRSEVIFMVKTTVMDHVDLAILGEKASDRVMDARIGIRNGLLPWSNDKLVSAHLLDAQKHLDAGNTKKALWSVNLALHLAPTSKDAITLKEEITGEPMPYYDQTFFGSLGDDMIDAEIEQLPAEEEVIMLEQSLGSTEPAEEETSTFVAPVAGFTEADKSEAAENDASTTIVVDMFDELTVEGEVADASTPESEAQTPSESEEFEAAVAEVEVDFVVGPTD